MTRATDELRPTEIEPYPTAAAGSVVISQGDTRVLCTASLSAELPAWLIDPGTGQSRHGWVTAEYAMLPGSTPQRKARGPDSRGTEIQRVIGRVLRASVDLDRMPGVLVACDCDVIVADGGTRTAAITGGFVALSQALSTARARGLLADDPVRGPVAAVSVGIVEGVPWLDLDYRRDVAADVDMNVAMNHRGEYVEIQATGEKGTLERAQLDALLNLAGKGITQLIEIQRRTLDTLRSE